MAFALIWSPTAKLDLWDILSYIADSNPSAAAHFGQKVFDKVELLINFPESGRVVPEFGDVTIREIIQKPCRIVYRINVNDRTIEIARIWHASRGIPEI
jgi:toxin ParE1/3/4